MRWFSRATDAWSQRARTSGEPASRNGASSLHLIWDLPVRPLVECSAVLEVVVPPAKPRLYFWALQASFATGAHIHGGAHLGLQWNSKFPGGMAANWGGYASDGSILPGSESLLPSARHDPNTRDYPWVAGHRYRLRIARSGEAPDGLVAWRGTVTHLESGEETCIRDLHTRGEYLIGPMVWSEVFARCEHPAVVARWSDPRAVTAEGADIRPAHVRVNYQTRADGGCDNTTAGVDEIGILQVTNARRRVPQDAKIPVPGVDVPSC
ncbi:MAG: hypothetical protein KJ698_13225 [Actinobacteria bacterium]|nr:hypothetical protein [Actinomycetota bacterium]